jgi:hypothetical protein
MTNTFSSMAYPHWLRVAGAVLLMLGIVGLALCRRGAETELDDIASGQDQVERRLSEEQLEFELLSAGTFPAVIMGSEQPCRN